MKFLYLAKDPDDGVIADLENISSQGQVTVVACLPAFVEAYEFLGYNTITRDQFFLLSNMHFDVVIGNPPYTKTDSIVGAKEGGCSGGLDNQFYTQAVKLSGYVSLIIRSKHFAKKSSKFRRELFSTGHVSEVTVLSEDTFPSISLTETCVVTYNEKHEGPCKVTYSDGTVKYIELTEDTCLRLTNPDYVAEVENNMAYRYQRGDLNLNQLMDGDCPMVVTMGAKGKDMVVKNVDKSQHTCCVNQHGVVLNSKYGGNGTGKAYVKPYGYSVSGSAIILKTDTQEEAEKLRDYILSEEVQSMVDTNKISNANTQELFKTIPDLPA